MIRKANASDAGQILALYKMVAAVPGGVARSIDEVGAGYVNGFMARAAEDGIELVCTENDIIVAEIHTARIGIACFSHLLTDLTIAVSPQAQGRGLGRALFQALLEHVSQDMPHITRVELFTRESNLRARALYASLGFVEEGRLRGRVNSGGAQPEADIIMAWLRD